MRAEGGTTKSGEVERIRVIEFHRTAMTAIGTVVAAVGIVLPGAGEAVEERSILRSKADRGPEVAAGQFVAFGGEMAVGQLTMGLREGTRRTDGGPRPTRK